MNITDCNILNDVYKEFEANTKNVESYLRDNRDSSEKQLKITKILFDLERSIQEDASILEKDKKPSLLLNELLIDGFHQEQIWQQIEVINKRWENSLTKRIYSELDLLKKNSSELIINNKKSSKRTAEDLETSTKKVRFADEEDEDHSNNIINSNKNENNSFTNNENKLFSDDDDECIDDVLFKGSDADDSEEEMYLKNILKKYREKEEKEFGKLNDRRDDRNEKYDIGLFDGGNESDLDESDDDGNRGDKKKFKKKENKFKKMSSSNDSDLEDSGNGKKIINDDSNDDAFNLFKSSLKKNNRCDGEEDIGSKKNKRLREDKSSFASSQKKEVEDTFFKLVQMEEFLERQEAKERRNAKVDGSDSDDDGDMDLENDDIDMFKDSSDYDENDKDQQQQQGGGGIKYEEFFDQPEDLNPDDSPQMDDDEEDSSLNDSDNLEEDASIPDNDQTTSIAKPNRKKKSDKNNDNKDVDFIGSDSMEDNDSDDDDETDEMMLKSDTRELIRDDSISNNNNNKSSFEKRQESMKRYITDLEEKSLAEKPWQLKGEIGSNARPENSLMEVVLDFDTATKPAMIVTEEVTKSIEEKILQRLKDNVWDGPKRKVKVKESAFNLKKKIVLNQEKSQLSLAKIYEKEYLEQNQKEEAKLPAEFDEIKNSMTSLFKKLDALSNFHFTPKPAIPEIMILANQPSIAIEEVAPVAISDAMMLAPQEIMAKKKRALIGANERTKTDKRRERRLKKKLQRDKRLVEEKREKVKSQKVDKNTILKNLEKEVNINELTKKVKTKKRNVKKTGNKSAPIIKKFK